MSNKAAPPALPPRASSSSIPTNAEPLPAYTELDTGPYAFLAPDDPRSSSTQSLLPEDTPQHDNRRTLLLVYVHGFMGTETSFQSFPLHVHRYLTLLLADSHVVHTKIYPRYRSKRQINFARDDFSRWLTPHESPETDVVLLGHSMGGLLVAEVALMPATSPTSGNAFKHRILGTVNFDVPYLGMHPGVVSAGLASIFRGKSPERKAEQGESSSTMTSPSTTTVNSADGASLSPVTTNTSSSSQPPKWISSLLSQPDISDPNYNPKFNNDVNLPVRKGWNKALHFVNKHSDNLLRSSQNLIKSHMEFGGAMADYSGLKIRYNRLRMLEDDDERERRNVVGGGAQRVPRVRFVNYYTASTGKPKKPPAGVEAREDELRGRLAGASALTLATDDTRASSRSRSPSPRISVEEIRESGEVLHKQAKIPETPKVGNKEDDTASESSLDITQTLPDFGGLDQLSFLPPTPPEPQQPDPVNLTLYNDPDMRKAVERSHSRAMRAYEQAVRDRKVALRDLAKLKAKYGVQDREGRSTEASKAGDTRSNKVNEGDTSTTPTSASVAPPSDEQDVLARYRSAEAAAMAAHRDTAASSVAQPPVADTQSIHTMSEAGGASLTTVASTADSERGSQPGKNKKKKDRKFCMLPKKNAQGERDPTWVRIFMKDIDEVTAHCGLFMQDSDTYEMLVGEVGQRIEEWIREDMSRRAVEAHS